MRAQQLDHRLEGRGFALLLPQDTLRAQVLPGARADVKV
jgi:hypothetical protein